MGNKQKGPPSLQKQIFQEVKMALVFGLPAIISYASVLSNESYYEPCTTSSASYRWAYAYWIYTIVNTGICCLLIPYYMKQADRMEKENGAVKPWKIARGMTKLLLLIGNFVVYFGLCYAYNTGEDCSHLTRLILSFIILFPVIFVLVVARMTYKYKKRKNEIPQPQRVETDLEGK